MNYRTDQRFEIIASAYAGAPLAGRWTLNSQQTSRLLRWLGSTLRRALCAARREVRRACLWLAGRLA